MTPADKITITPSLLGQKSRAWRCNIANMRRTLGVKPADDPTIAWWLIEAIWAHPVWHSYLLTLHNLQSRANLPNAILFVPSATHEIVLHALDPKGQRQSIIGGDGRLGKGTCQPLIPVNFAAQFACLTDQAAEARVKNAVQMICDGKLSPDTDYIGQWIDLFGGNMIKGGPTLQ